MKKAIYSIFNNKNFCVLSVLILFSLLSHPAFAANTNTQGLPYEGWLMVIVNSMTGPVAYGVAILAFFGSGAALIWAGAEMNGFLKTVIYLILVLSFVVAAKNSYTAITGKGAEITPPVHTVMRRY